MKKLLLNCLIVCICKYGAYSLKLPGPSVYVVTPSSRPQQSEGRAAPAPFYYHNWMRRMDPPRNETTTTTTQSPDLIFAEFESGNKMKSIRKLLEKERISPTTTTTARPIYVPEETNTMSHKVNYGLPPLSDVKKEAEMPTTPDMTDYYALYNNKYNIDTAPVYSPSTTPATLSTTAASTAAPVTIAHIPNVQNIWHIIDSQKHDEYSGKWEEVTNDETEEQTEAPKDHEDDSDDVAMDDNFALPGFGTNPGNGAENESRAIRTEPNIRFPYVNLKPFQVKTQKKPVSDSKKGTNMYTSLDNFYDMKNPVRGEAQDVVPMTRQPIDRYNPAQPYLPQPSYGSKSKQSSPSVTPMKAVANLVPPPPPPPRITDGDFPAPTSYESFPPYSPPAPSPPSIIPQPPVDASDDSTPDFAPDSDGPPDYSYRYKPPSPPAQTFLPTLPPLTKPYRGYSYDKPPMTPDSPPGGGYSYDKPSPMTPDSPPGGGYSYDKPSPMTPDSPPGGGYSYDKPSPMPDSAPESGYSYGKPQMMPDPSPANGYSYDKPPMVDIPPDDNKPDFHGYHYSKPDYAAPPQESPSSYGPEPDHYQYPELIFDKPHGGKGGSDSDMKDVGMAPPPPPKDMDNGPPADDQGFPHDFHGGDLKFAHDFDEHDHDYHYHHHHTTTTTTTTETPRVNRYSYYYLGKKLYYLPLYFSVYFIVYVGALIIKAVLRHKIVYPNSWRPNTAQTQTAGFFSKRSIDSYDFSNEHLHEITGKVTHAIAEAGKKYFNQKKKK